MASNLLNTLEKIERGRKKCIQLANEVNYPLPEDASLEQIAQCINAQGYADEYYDCYKAWLSKDFSTIPDGKLRLPDDLETIGNRAFYYQTDVDFIWPRNLKRIGESAFRNGSFKSRVIDIPNTVTRIDTYAFDYLSVAHTINVPSSVTTIAGYAFLHTPKGTILNFDARVKTLEMSTFGNGNSSGVGQGATINITDEALDCIETIKSSVFENANLTRVPWTEKTKLGLSTEYSSPGSTFKYVKWLCPVKIPSTLWHENHTSIGSSAFAYGWFTEGLEFDSGLHRTILDNYSFQAIRVNNDVLEFPESINNLGSYACKDMCKYDVTTPSSTSTKMDRVIFPNKEKMTLNSQALNNVWSNHIIIYAKTLIMNNSQQCFTMTSSTSGCANIVFLNMESVPNIVSNTFNTGNLSKGGSYIYLPDDLVAEAKAKQYWSSFASYIKPLSSWSLYSQYAEHILPREEA